MYSIVGWQVFVCFQHLWHTVIPVEHYLLNKTDNLMEHNLFELQAVHFCQQRLKLCSLCLYISTCRQGGTVTSW